MKRVIAFVLTLTMLLAIVPFSALNVFAAEESSAFDSNNKIYINANWYTEQTAAHTGEEGDPYEINSEADWVAFCCKVSGAAAMGTADNFTGKYIVLTKDLTYNTADKFVFDENGYVTGVTSGAINCPSVGFNYKAFSGTFNGNGHTISGMYIAKPASTVYLTNGASFNSGSGLFYGLFNSVQSGTVKNLVLENIYINANQGAIVTNSAKSATFENITVKKSCTFENAAANNRVGGIIGSVDDANCRISKCTVSGKVIGLKNRVSAFAGVASNVSLDNCLFDGLLVSTSTSATALGMATGGTATNCLSVGSFEKAIDGSYSNFFTVNKPSTFTKLYYLEGTLQYLYAKNADTTGELISVSQETINSVEFSYQLNSNTDTRDVWGYDGQAPVLVYGNMVPAYKITLTCDGEEDIVAYTMADGQLTAKPSAKAGYSLKVGSLDFDEYINSHSFTSDETITYSYISETAETVDVTVSCDSLSGTVTVDGLPQTSVVAGGNVVLNAVANRGYDFSGWYLEGSETPFSNESTYTYENVVDALSVTARFTKKNGRTVSVTSEGGTVTPDLAPDNGVYYDGETVTFTATPDASHKFVNWTVDGVESETAVITFNGSDVNVVANYRVLAEVNIVANAFEGGSASSDKATAIEEGMVVFTATPNDGYRFAGWVDANRVPVSKGNPYTASVSTSDIVLYATFVAVEEKTFIERGTSLLLNYNTCDTSWYDNAAEGVGDTAENPYVIDSLQGWVGFAKLVNNGNDFAGKFVSLNANLNFNSHSGAFVRNEDGSLRVGGNCSPCYNVGNNSKVFAGTFDGNGNTLSGFRFDHNNNSAGLGTFGIVTGTIKNLNVEHSFVNSNGLGGGLICYRLNGGSIINCHVNDSTMDFTKNNTHSIGLIVGETVGDVTIEKCSAEGVVKSQYNRVGAIVGQIKSGSVTLKDCVNKANVYTTHSDALASAIVGYSAGGTLAMENVFNYGLVTSPNGYTTFTGVTPTTAVNCYNLTGTTAFEVGTTVNSALIDTASFDTFSTGSFATAMNTAKKMNIWFVDNTGLKIKVSLNTGVALTSPSIDVVGSALVLNANAIIEGNYTNAGFEIFTVEEFTEHANRDVFNHDGYDASNAKNIEFTAEQLCSGNQYYVSLNNFGVVNAVKGYIIFPYYVEYDSDVRVYGEGEFLSFYLAATALADENPGLQPIVNVCDLVVLDREVATYPIGNGNYGNDAAMPVLASTGSGIGVKANLNYGAAHGGFKLIAKFQFPAGTAATATEKGVYFIKVSDLGAATTVEEAVANEKAIRLEYTGSNDQFNATVTNFGIVTAKTGFVAVAYYKDGTGTHYSNACYLNYYNMMRSIYYNEALPQFKTLANNILAACNVVL